MGSFNHGPQFLKLENSFIHLVTLLLRHAWIFRHIALPGSTNKWDFVSLNNFKYSLVVSNFSPLIEKVSQPTSMRNYLMIYN